ncbi:MAG TPA: hypothetical protein VF647_24685 [Longimicrobium sp.]
MSIAIAALALTACSGSTGDDQAAKPARDTVAAPAPAAAGHDMHAITVDGTSVDTGSAHAGMQHGAAAHEGMDHGAAGGQAHAATSGAQAMDHSRMGHTAAESASHSGSHARSGRAAAGTTDHTQHSGARRNANRPAESSHSAVDHATATGTETASASTNHAAMGHSTAASTRPAEDRATDKLLTLVGELVRDPAVQQEIRDDPALREAWEDPGVRRVVTKQP